LGIDIDGVLNKHRDQFSLLLYEKTGRKIDPDDITVLPVHEDDTLNVKREDERLVFNDPKYWTDMPVIEDAANVIQKLRNMFNIKICIFTHRPWPEDEDRTNIPKMIESF